MAVYNDWFFENVIFSGLNLLICSRQHYIFMTDFQDIIQNYDGFFKIKLILQDKWHSEVFYADENLREF